MKLPKRPGILPLKSPAFLVISILCILSACYKGLSTNGGLYVSEPYGPGANVPVGNIDSIIENKFIQTADSATTTFSIDADGGSYALSRKVLQANGDLKVYKNAIRTEEFINYFTYDYADPSDNNSIATNGEVSTCPWNQEHKLIRIGIKGKSITKENYPAANFVLLIDVSGSMGSPDKLELLKKGFIEFAKQMRTIDRIAIVTYAGSESLALESTTGANKTKIISAIERLGSGGSTNGAGGITLAYKIANENFIAGGNNRVILGTDGDFNVGITDTDQLIKLIEEQKTKGIYLTTLGVGMDNYNESMMEKIANKGDGTYEYLDTEQELKKVFVDEYNKFVTVARDVKVQVTFNKDIVEEYRLIGYENRVLQNDDFTDDSKDAGEIGAGQTITAIYEIKPRPGVNFKNFPSFEIDIRYKKTNESSSIPLTLEIFDRGNSFSASSESMRFSASLAALGMYLRGSAYKGTATLADIRSWANGARNFDPYQLRSKHIEFLDKIK